VAVWIAEIETAPATPVIDLHVVERARSAAIGETLGAHALEDRVELGLADLERVMVALELRIIVEIQGQRVVDSQRSEVRERTLVAQTKNAGEEPRRCLLVVRRHDRMVEHNGHRHLLRVVVSPHMGRGIADVKGFGPCGRALRPAHGIAGAQR
jgi:hypothetical protein